MPYYRMDRPDGNTTWVHMRGTKMPATCTAQDADLGERCERPGGFACDGVLPNGLNCDRPLCERHAHGIGPDRHLCPLCRERRS